MREILFGSLAIICVAISGSASAQSMPSEMRKLLQQKYEIEQQRADAEQARAEADRSRAQTEANALQRERRRSSANQVTQVLRTGDVMAGWDVPTYQLPNGVTMRFSGGVRPGSDWQCLANCFQS